MYTVSHKRYSFALLFYHMPAGFKLKFSERILVILSSLLSKKKKKKKVKIRTLG